MKYIRARKKQKCFLCLESKEDEELVIYKGKRCFVIMNAYPYNNGHVMVAPYRHISSLLDLSDEETREFFELVKQSVIVLNQTMKPEGFNIGINLGKAAGAGETHLHLHIVPRWIGDTNFMPVLADVKVMPEYLERNCKVLRETFKIKNKIKIKKSYK
jgi:ATP adenylyltransferase